MRLQILGVQIFWQVILRVVFVQGTPIRAKQPAMPWEGDGLLPGIMCGDFYK